MKFISLYLICQFFALPIQAGNKNIMSKIWTNGDEVIWMSRKYCGKRRNCLLQAISHFPTMFSKGVCRWCVKMMHPCHCISWTHNNYQGIFPNVGVENLRQTTLCSSYQCGISWSNTFLVFAFRFDKRSSKMSKFCYEAGSTYKHQEWYIIAFIMLQLLSVTKFWDNWHSITLKGFLGQLIKLVWPPPPPPPHTHTHTLLTYLNETFKWHIYLFRRKIVPNYIKIHP